MESMALPDVVGYKLLLAEEKLKAADWKWQIEETIPYRLREEFVRRKEFAFVLKQTLTPDNICVLLVGYKVGKEV